MRVLADESVESGVVAHLRAGGHDVLYVAEAFPGSADPDVLGAARREGRVLVTADTDFGDLAVRFGQPSAGIVLLRLAGVGERTAAQLAGAALTDHKAELTGTPPAFVVARPGGVRTRRIE